MYGAATRSVGYRVRIADCRTSVHHACPTVDDCIQQKSDFCTGTQAEKVLDNSQTRLLQVHENVRFQEIRTESLWDTCVLSVYTVHIIAPPVKHEQQLGPELNRLISERKDTVVVLARDDRIIVQTK